MAWFPAVGALLGLTIGGLWWLVAKAWPPLVAAAIVVIADLIFTGGLHFDGLADAGDGLLAPLSKERRLQAMADPAIGAFGALTVAAVLLLRFGSLADLRPAPLVLGGLWCASRTSMVAIVETVPYARTSGIVQSFLGTSPRGTRQRVVMLGSITLGLLVATGLVLLGRGARGLWALVGELAAMGAVAMFSWRRVGGFTGDVLGAAGVIGETVGLLILVTR
jgi:adenosylcobinamide-GDP ribazoletransferase